MMLSQTHLCFSILVNMLSTIRILVTNTAFRWQNYKNIAQAINIYIHAKHYTYYMKHISACKLRSAIDTMRYFSFCHRKVGNERKWKDAEALGVVSFHGNGGV